MGEGKRRDKTVLQILELAYRCLKLRNLLFEEEIGSDSAIQTSDSPGPQLNCCFSKRGSLHFSILFVVEF